MKVGDRIFLEAVVSEHDDDLGCFTAELTGGDWFVSEDGRIKQASKHWS